MCGVDPYKQEQQWQAGGSERHGSHIHRRDGGFNSSSINDVVTTPAMILGATGQAPALILLAGWTVRKKGHPLLRKPTGFSLCRGNNQMPAHCLLLFSHKIMSFHFLFYFRKTTDRLCYGFSFSFVYCKMTNSSNDNFFLKVMPNAVAVRIKVNVMLLFKGSYSRACTFGPHDLKCMWAPYPYILCIKREVSNSILWDPNKCWAYSLFSIPPQLTALRHHPIKLVDTNCWMK